MPVYFHIGYPKTASTWLQENVFPHIADVHYVDSRATAGLFFETDAFLFNPEDVHRYLSRCTGGSKYLFSSELLTTPINYGWHYGCVSRVCADRIHSAFPEAAIILFIRNQQSLAASAYQQYVKNGGTYSVKRFLYNSHFSHNHLLFDGLIAYYDRLFGSASVHVFLYEELARDPRAFMAAFCARLGLDLDCNRVDFTAVNRGMRVGLIPLVKFLNLFHAKPRGRKRMIVELPKFVGFINRCVKPMNRYGVFGPHATYLDLLDEADLDHFRRTFGASNRRLAERVGYDRLKEHGYFL